MENIKIIDNIENKENKEKEEEIYSLVNNC
jgi:hypothetical protein